MSSDNKFIDGLIVKAPHENAPDYVIAKLSIKREALIAWLTAQSGEWINADIKRSQGGKLYAAVDDWKPEGAKGGGKSAPRPQKPRDEDPFPDSEIPFVTNRSVW